MGVKIVEGKGTVFGINVGHPIVTNGDVVILCREGWRRGSSQITLERLVKLAYLLTYGRTDGHDRSHKAHRQGGG